MERSAIFAGLGCGALFAEACLVSWGCLRRTSLLSRAVMAVGWLAASLLALGALFAWRAAPYLSDLALRSLPVAALAALPCTDRSRAASWGDALAVLPALALAGLGLACLVGGSGGATVGLPMTPAGLAALVCGGLGARATGEGLREVAAPGGASRGWLAAAYTPLTLLVSGVALANLWRRGMVWTGSVGEARLAGAWLALSAAWVASGRRVRLRAGLAVVALLALLAAVLVV